LLGVTPKGRRRRRRRSRLPLTPDSRDLPPHRPGPRRRTRFAYAYARRHFQLDSRGRRTSFSCCGLASDSRLICRPGLALALVACVAPSYQLAPTTDNCDPTSSSDSHINADVMRRYSSTDINSRLPVYPVAAPLQGEEVKEKAPEEEVTPGYKRLYADRSLAGPQPSPAVAPHTHTTRAQAIEEGSSPQVSTWSGKPSNDSDNPK
jgi:hypothetical protein